MMCDVEITDELVNSIQEAEAYTTPPVVIPRSQKIKNALKKFLKIFIIEILVFFALGLVFFAVGNLNH